MTITKKAFWATTALTGALLLASAASAQSTASQQVEAETAEDAEVTEVVVTGTRGIRNIEGIAAEQAPRARTTITQELIATQQAGQSIFQTLNLTPGLNFVNSDPYGASGGNVRLRGFDGNRISLTFDGIPLNDTGNYAIFTNQQLDPELISQANVNTGTTDVDSPTASATGGTINYVTRRPAREFGGFGVGTVGSFDFRRIFALIDTGEFGPFGTTAYMAGSYQDYDKFRGAGDLTRQQYNGMIRQEFGDGNFAQLSLNYNENRNNQYRNVTLAQFRQFGGSFDQDVRCTRITPTNGVADNEGSTTSGNTIETVFGVVSRGSCTNYFGTRVNPSNTGNIRLNTSYNITENLRITVDPSFQYVLANGGGFTLLSETDGRLRGVGLGAAQAAGADLNGDGDVRDTVQIYTPNNTNTRRYGLNTSLIYDLNDDHRFRVAYTNDYGRHRQTAEGGFYDLAGNPENVFAGKEGRGDRIGTADGSFYRGRDRFSIASLNQISFQYRGNFYEDRLLLDLGVRIPYFTRELNNYCFSQVNSANVRCTTETPNATFAETTNLDEGGTRSVTFAATGATRFLEAYETERKYDDVLPNIGITYRPGDNHQVYVAYAQGFSAPRTDNLYAITRDSLTNVIDIPDVDPEITRNYDIGYRYQSARILATATAFYNEFENRIVSSFDPDSGTFIDRNVGTVELRGVEGSITYAPEDYLLFYVTGSYLDSELQDDIQVGRNAQGVALFLPTAGRELVETPRYQFAGRIEYSPTEALRLGFQGKYVGDRFSTDVNDEVAEDYITVDFDARYELARFGQMFDGSYLQLNITNLFDEDYLGNISTQNTALGVPGVISAGTTSYSVGAPFTATISLRAEF